MPRGDWDTTPKEMFKGMLAGGVDDSNLPVPRNAKKLFEKMGKSAKTKLDSRTRKQCDAMIAARAKAVRMAKEYTDSEGEDASPIKLYDFMGWTNSMTSRERYRKRRVAEAKTPQKSYTEEEILNACKLMEQGVPYNQVYKKTGIGLNTLKRTWQGERHRKITGYEWNPKRQSPAYDLKKRRRENLDALRHSGIGN